ncbi:hypothetical protein PFMALIP_01677 [Plasmodium falciparum MaliPS096_E11]|uniref:Uncharacterized protein n=2 Tax=Plasmodium falciparum TaxID=5833 RepID=A0A024XBC2_PLAFC|nr:hypothetical protein PFMALIP_01677 [Plasmodium falciparum MaliPS096_E11]ETW62468.1 hypothetical protein PFMC_01656 [Plasmodium falciparum CAMP/Malaysia]
MINVENWKDLSLYIIKTLSSLKYLKTHGNKKYKSP